MNEYTSTDITNVRNYVAAFTGGRSDASILGGWTFVAALVAEHGKGAADMVNAMLEADLSPNMMTRVVHPARLIALVDDITDPMGAQSVATEYVYMAASKAGKGRSVAVVTNAMVKDGKRFATIAALAAHLEAERKGAVKADKGATEQAEQTYEMAIGAMLKRAEQIAVDFNTDVFSILSDVADKAEAALDSTEQADAAAA